MKKLLSILLILCLYANNIYAETYTGNTSISLSYSKLPCYSIKIPKLLDISQNNTSFNYYVSGDIYADQTLQVLFSDVTQIQNEDKTCKVYISQEKDLFTPNELNNNHKYCAYISHANLSPGKWHGNLNVVISLTGD